MLLYYLYCYLYLYYLYIFRIIFIFAFSVCGEVEIAEEFFCLFRVKNACNYFYLYFQKIIIQFPFPYLAFYLEMVNDNYLMLIDLYDI